MTPSVEPLEPRQHLSAVVQDPAWRPVSAKLFALNPAGLPVGLATVEGENRVVTYNRSGSIASSFAIDTPYSSGFFSGWGELAIDGQGRVVHAYAADRTKDVDFWPDFTRLRRFNADGTPDTTVGRNGEVAIVPPVGTGEHVWIGNMVANASGQIAMSVSDDRDRTYLARFTERGPLDAAWGDSGYLEIKKGGVQSIILYDDGSMHVIGYNADGRYVLALDARGRTRTDLWPEGRFVFPAAFRQGLTDVLTVDPQNRVYMSIGERPPRLYPNNQLPGGLPARSLSRLLPDGSIDRSFGVDGFVTLDSPDGSMITSDTSGYTVGAAPGAGAFDAQGRFYFMAADQLFRLTPQAQLDPTFDFDGRADARINTSQLLPADDGVYLTSWSSVVHHYLPSGAPGLRRDGTLVVAAQRADTLIKITHLRGYLRVTIDGASTHFSRREVSGVEVHLSDGDDVLDYQSDKPVTIRGGDGNDLFEASIAHTDIDLSLGDDTFRGGIGNDTIRAGEGVDTINVGSGVLNFWSNASRVRALDGVREAAGGVTLSGKFNDRDRARISLGGGDDRVDLIGGRISIEDAGQGGTNRITLRTMRGASVALAYARNILDTFDGDDTITTADGRDTIRTRRGDDHVARRRTRYGILLPDPRPDTIFTGAGDDTLWGSDAADHLDAGAGDDQLYPGPRLDTLFGGTGTDTLFRPADDDEDILDGIETISPT